MVTIDKGSLTYKPTCVIYKGKRYDAPVYLSTLQAWDLICNILRERQNERESVKD